MTQQNGVSSVAVFDLYVLENLKHFQYLLLFVFADVCVCLYVCVCVCVLATFVRFRSYDSMHVFKIQLFIEAFTSIRV